MLSTRTGLSPATARLSRRFRFLTFGHWPGPRSLATTSGVSVDVLSSGYLDVSVRRVCFPHLYIQCGMTLMGRVSPFGNPRIKVYSQLPEAYRRVPRPSSPLSAKASTKCPYALARKPSHAGANPKGGHPWRGTNLRKDTFHGNPHRDRSCGPVAWRLPCLGQILIHNDKERGTRSLAGAAPTRATARPRAGVVRAIRMFQNPEVASISPVRFTRSALVELTGIEPVTSCLQSRRSPN